MASLVDSVAPRSFPTLQHLSLVGLLAPWQRVGWARLHSLFKPLVSLTLEIACYNPEQESVVAFTNSFLRAMVIPDMLQVSTSLQELNLEITVVQGYGSPCLILEAGDLSFPHLKSLCQGWSVTWQLDSGSRDLRSGVLERDHMTIDKGMCKESGDHNYKRAKMQIIY